MKNLFSSKMKLLFFFWLVLVAALLLLCWLYYGNLKNELSEEAQKRAVQNLKLVHWILSQPEDIENPEQLQTYLTDLGREMGFRITYIAQGGRVIADSEVPLAHIGTLDNHASRPEIMQARSQETGLATRFSHTSQQELIYAAKTILLRGSAAPGVVRLAIPWSTFKNRFDRVSKVFIMAMLLTFLVIAIISYVLIRQLDKPIQTMIAATEAIGQGDYRQRLHFQPGHEFYSLARSINTTAELIDRQIQTITEQKQQLEAVFNGMKEGLMVLDSQGKLKDVNMAMAEIIPFASQNMGRRPLEATLSLELQKACDYVLSTGSDPGSYPYKLQVALRGGKSIYDVSIVRLVDRLGGIGAIAVFHDISELKRLEKVRQDFVANVSHELRTPLTSVKGYTETLLSQESHDPETLFSFLQVILKNTNHMVKMVDDLLQLARLEAQPVQTGMAVANALEALDVAWKACLPFAEEKSVTLEHHPPEQGLHVAVEFDQLVQVFRNLLENAVKYSPAGEKIDVTSRVAGNKVTFSIRDNGPGIPGQHQQRVFERFYRVEKHRGKYPGSTGLGLSICRHIIINHGGKIWLTSPNEPEGRGTTFHFTLASS